MKNGKLIISHRANISGPNTALFGENNPKSIEAVLDMEFLCEVDARWIEGEGFFLGHDEPEYKVDKSFLYNHKLFIHCKDVITYIKLNPLPYTYVKLFLHQTDDVALILNSDLLWSYPRADVTLTSCSIAAMPELVDNWNGLDICAGICSDYPIKYKYGAK